MGRYILRRLGMTVLVVLIASIVVFTLVYFVPGDPVKVMMSPESTVAELEAKRHELGLDQPFLVQMGTFLYNAFIRFDMGTSWIRGVPVMDGLVERLPYTLELGIISILVSTLIAIPLGVTAATHQNGWQDRVCMVFAMICISLPDFWIALLMIILFALQLNWLPAFGIGGVQYLVMPVIAMSLKNIGSISRQTRSSMLEVIRSDYITTARAKGLRERDVVYKHMLPNALSATIVGTTMGMGNTILVAASLSFIGLGVQPPTPEWGAMLSSGRDVIRKYPHIMMFPGIFIFLTVLSFNLFGDGLRDALDPKLKK